ncbi:alpha-N-methyltransferase NTM1 [Coniella lustricola]|uniref:Alpha N-terminal protein methyltransferase 1 n=1 Tax=Coniella lustricola TaxID=2025994 RepID=A0A2T3AFM6_9PEZI|nr:alpha-N-methyltransferase NTM1 [Coniella lustricola]
MLGGFPYVSRIDLQGSRNFLAKLGIGTKSGLRIAESALEGGAGIGRITEGLLLQVSQEVDVVEPIAKFTQKLATKTGVRQVFNIGLEEWEPRESDQYDLVWNQWCLGHLNDDQLMRYLERCKQVLTPNTGLIIVKENITSGIVEVFDEQDSAVTRTDKKFLEIFQRAGLKVVKSEIQKGLPKELFPVKAYALRPQD